MMRHERERVRVYVCWKAEVEAARCSVTSFVWVCSVGVM